MSRWWLRATLVASCAVICLLARADDSSRTTKQNKRLPRRAAVDAYILGPTELIAGSGASYRIAVHWASSPRRFGPLPGASVALALRADKRTVDLTGGLTDAAGNVDLRFTVPRLKTGAYHLLVRIRSSLGGVTRQSKVRVYPGGRLLLTTDKKLYQPSQTIHIRALALRSMDLRPVARRPIRIQVIDPKGNVVFSKQDRTSRFGVGSLDFKLADEINLGHYTVQAWSKGAGANARSTLQVEVKRYVLPKFKVTVETDRRYYRPGDTVRGTVRCRYFFGKAVAGARVTLDARTRLSGVTHHHQPTRLTDNQGRATFELKLQRRTHEGTGELRVLAAVADTAGHRERGDVSVPVTSRPLQLAVFPENDRLVRGVRNRIHVIAGYPDGQPATGARVSLQLPGQASLEQDTDAVGVATFELSFSAGRRCLPLRLKARDSHGERRAQRACLPVAPKRTVLVRPARSIVAPGQAVEMALLASMAPRPSENQVYLDVVKAGQTLATYSARLRRGRARVRFEPDARLFGLLELRAYRLKRDGERVGLSRMIYVDHPGELKIEISPDKKVYRPGERARLKFRVVDSRTGDGVQAALGVLGVDEAVVAMGGLEPESSPKVFFTLASQAQGSASPVVSPGGRDLKSWVAEQTTDAARRWRRARAADVLLAAVRPAQAPVWETNPWRDRRERWQSQAPALVSTALTFMRDHSVGRRTSKGWRFRPDLVALMAREGAIKADQILDPWKRTVRPWHLRATDSSFEFTPHAHRLAPQKLKRIYDVLRSCWTKLKLPRESMHKLKKKQWPLILPRDLLGRLVRLGKLKRGEILDPWGKTYRIARHPRLFVNPYYTGLISRYLIHSAGPDGVSGTADDIGPTGPRVWMKDAALGTDAEHALGGLIGNQIGESYGIGGLGLAGTGRGGGGSGEGTIGLGTVGTIGHGGGGSMQTRVRSKFPETLLWKPELITDRNGNATLDVALADSITDWRIVTTGSTTSGLLGTRSTTLRVFQDFFVDIDLPVALTQGDRISVPVSVYNYLKKPQRVTLKLKRERWFTAAGPLQQTIELRPNQVGVRHFPIVARRVGRQDLTVHAATAGGMADAVRRTTLVEPDGVEHALSHGGGLRPGGDTSHVVGIPPQVIDGTARIHLAIYAGPMGQTLDGMEGMLRRPYGCFEQTSSATYPNLLVLDYLRRMGQVTPAVEQKAKALINEGYQRLIGFEVPGGGFSWFGKAPANRVLTAYGLMEFHDMARVHPVDPKLIARTQRWLASQQHKDGTWRPDSHAINEGATNNFRSNVLRITAYIAHALRHTGYRGSALKRALGHVRRNARRAKDPYTLAMVANLLARDRDRTARDVRSRLWAQRKRTEQGIYFPGPSATLTHGAGTSGRLESTALGALALLEGGHAPAETGKLVDTLVASKDSFGSWHSTQATILSLRALLKQHEVSRDRPRGEVQVLVDGRLRRRVRLRGEQDATHRLDLTSFMTPGSHQVTLRFDKGKGSLQYHLSGHYWVPRTADRPRASGSLAIRTRFDRLQARPGQRVQLDVEVANRAGKPVDMPLVTLALPPGFALEGEGLVGLVKAGKVDKVQRVGNRAVLYLTRLKARSSLRFSLGLRGKYPLRIQARPATVYEYYRPENRAESMPHRLKVL